MKTKLIITNLKDFFKEGFDKPFTILSKIETQVYNMTNSGNLNFDLKTKTLLVNYSKEGHVIFDLQSYEFKNDCNIFYYKYNSTVS